MAVGKALVNPRESAYGRDGQISIDQTAECGLSLVNWHTPLHAAVAISEGHGVVLQALAIHGDAERRAGLVLPAITATHSPLFVVEHGEPLA